MRICITYLMLSADVPEPPPPPPRACYTSLNTLLDLLDTLDYMTKHHRINELLHIVYEVLIH
jgi:hypothetical protein